jgi:hypothetical protein
VPVDCTGTLFMRVRDLAKYGSTSRVDTVLKAMPTSVPADPTGLTATIISGNQVDLDWPDAANNEDSYLIQRATGAGAFVTIDAVGININSYSDVSALPDNTYRYQVIAHNVLGNSLPSNVETVVLALPAAPTSLMFGGITGQVNALVIVQNLFAVGEMEIVTRHDGVSRDV